MRIRLIVAILPVLVCCAGALDIFASGCILIGYLLKLAYVGRS